MSTMRPRIQNLQRLEKVGLSYRSISQTPRFVHSSGRRNVSAQLPAVSPPFSPAAAAGPVPASTIPRVNSTTLGRLPTSSVLRSYFITRMSESPALLSLCFSILKRMLESKSYLTNIERNPVLNRLLKSTFYAQFCAGETVADIRTNSANLRQVLGYDGVILEYALEVLGGKTPTEAETAKEIEVWRKGMLASVETAVPGDFVGLKWSGLGRHALHLLKQQAEATPEMWSAITAACDAAAAKGVSLLPGAEEEVTNLGLEKWNLALQKKYNTPERGYAVVYTTYQCYGKNVSARLAKHLEIAQKEGYIAGVKLVRGAYMLSEPAEVIWETKEKTDACYNESAEAVLTQQWNERVPAPSPSAAFPTVNIILATHNLPSIQKAQEIRARQLLSQDAESLPRLAYAQLLGMADEISQSLVQDEKRKADVNSKVVKLMTFGTATECLNFLLRRASENKEAMGRTEDTRRAMGAELSRRVKAVFGLA